MTLLDIANGNIIYPLASLKTVHNTHTHTRMALAFKAIFLNDESPIIRPLKRLFIVHYQTRLAKCVPNCQLMKAV